MPNYLYDQVGTVVRRHRLAKGLSREVLAKRAGTTPARIDKYESDQAGLTERMLRPLAAALGISAERLSCECLLEAKPELRTKKIGKLFMEMAGIPDDYYKAKNQNGNGKHRETTAKAPPRIAAKAKGAKRNGSRANGHQTTAARAWLSKT